MGETPLYKVVLREGSSALRRSGADSRAAVEDAAPPPRWQVRWPHPTSRWPHPTLLLLEKYLYTRNTILEIHKYRNTRRQIQLRNTGEVRPHPTSRWPHPTLLLPECDVPVPGIFHLFGGIGKIWYRKKVSEPVHIGKIWYRN